MFVVVESVIDVADVAVLIGLGTVRIHSAHCVIEAAAQQLLWVIREAARSHVIIFVLRNLGSVKSTVEQ